MIQKNYSVRIVKKEKDGVTLKAKGNIQKMSWNEFNQNFDMAEDKMHATFKPEFLEKAEKINELVNGLVAFSIMAGKAEGEHKMTMLAVLGNKMEELAKEANCSLAEATQLVAKAKLEFLKSMSCPFGSGNPFKETPEEYRVRKATQAEANDPHRAYTPTATQTLGDLPGMDKLKNLKFN